MQEEMVNDTANEPAQKRAAEVLVGTKKPVMAADMEKVRENKCRGGSAGFCRRVTSSLTSKCPLAG